MSLDGLIEDWVDDKNVHQKKISLQASHADTISNLSYSRNPCHLKHRQSRYSVASARCLMNPDEIRANRSSPCMLNPEGGGVNSSNGININKAHNQPNFQPRSTRTIDRKHLVRLLLQIPLRHALFTPYSHLTDHFPCGRSLTHSRRLSDSFPILSQCFQPLFLKSISSLFLR